MCSLVDSSMFPDWGLKPHLWCIIGTTFQPTELPGQDWLRSLAMFNCSGAGVE